MRARLACGLRLMVMTAIVASVLYWPAGLALVALFALIGIPAESLLTLGGTFGVVSGMLAWWLFSFALALPYAACVFPWSLELDGFRDKKT
jgi:uncharacterized membrane protein